MNYLLCVRTLWTFWTKSVHIVHTQLPLDMDPWAHVSDEAVSKIIALTSHHHMFKSAIDSLTSTLSGQPTTNWRLFIILIVFQFTVFSFLTDSLQVMYAHVNILYIVGQCASISHTAGLLVQILFTNTVPGSFLNLLLLLNLLLTENFLDSLFILLNRELRISRLLILMRCLGLIRLLVLSLLWLLHLILLW